MQDRINRTLYAVITAVICAVGVGLRFPALQAGFIFDDYMQLEMYDGELWVRTSPWELYAFIRPENVKSLVASGMLPWWTDPALLAAPFRPLSSLLLWAQLRVFGPDPLALHLVSMAWWVGLVVAVARLARKLLAPGPALVAVLIYALSASHSLPVAWLANGCALVATTFGVLAFDAYLSWRRLGHTKQRWWALVWLTAALASGEYGLSVVALMVGYELVGRRDAWLPRLGALAPVVGLVMVHQLAMRLLGHGARGSFLYIDPFYDPGFYLMRVGLQLASFLTNAIFGTPAATGNPFAVLLALLGLGLGFGLTRPRAGEEDERRLERALLLGALLATLPLTAALYAPRLLIGAHVGTALFAGSLLWRLACSLGDGERTVTRRALLGLAALPFAFGHFFVAPVTSFLEVRKMAMVGHTLQRASITAPVTERPVVLLSAASVFDMYGPPIVRRRAGKSVPAGWWALSAADGRHRLTRVAPDVLEIECVTPALGIPGGLYTSANASLFRQPQTGPREGEILTAGPLTIRVLASHELFGPSRWQVHFPAELRPQFLVTGANGYEDFQLPAVGNTVTLPKAQLPGAAATAQGPWKP